MYESTLLKLIKSEPLARIALAVPAMGTLCGSFLLASGFLLPCILLDAFGLLLGLLIMISLLLKYLWIEHLLLSGEEISGKVLEQRDSLSLPLSPTTEIAYEYLYDGVLYKKRILVHLPEDTNLQQATVILDPDKPESSIIKELYCTALS